MSGACREAAKASIVMRPVDVVAVKGKKQGVKVYEPLALVSESDEKAESVAALSERAVDAYLSRRFDEASRLFAEVLRMLPADPAATTMRDRALRYQREPPGEDWSGAHVMTEK